MFVQLGFEAAAVTRVGPANVRRIMGGPAETPVNQWSPPSVTIIARKKNVSALPKAF